MTRTGIATLALLALHVFDPSGLKAQGFSPLSFEYYPAAGVTKPSPASGNGLQVSALRLNVGLALPVSFNRGRVQLVNGLRYELLSLAYSIAPASVPAPEVLHYVRYELASVYRLPRSWTATAYFAPGIASDLTGHIHEDDVHFRLALLFARNSGSFVYGLGATYRNQLSTPLLPLAQLQGHIGTRFRLNVLIPSHAQVWYILQPQRELELGVQMRFGSTPFHVRSGSGEAARVEHSLATLGPSFSMRLWRALYIGVDAGATLWHELQYHRPPPEHTLELERSFFLRSAITVKP